MDSCSVITKEDCSKILDRFSKEKYQLVNFKVIPFGSEPLGFLGEHSRLQITVNSNKYGILYFFMKTIPCTTNAHKNYVLNIGVFKKEALLYKNLIGKLHTLTKQQFSPNCYLVNTESHIILEDLSLKGYAVIKDKSKTLDYSHCLALTETVARFHSSSIIFEEQHTIIKNQPYRIYDHYKDMLYETTFSWKEGNARCDWVKITVETLLAVCKKLDDYKTKDISTPLHSLVEKMKQYIAPSKKYRNVLNHGDLWSNNIMFSNAENLPKKCILVDFQMARYVPPCFDFLSFLYLTTNKEFHEKHFNEFVDIYYTTFSSELNNHQINPDEILTKQEFLESCEFYKPAVLLEAAMFGTIVYLNGDFSKDMLDNAEKFDDFMRKDRSKLVCRLFDEDEIYRGRVESVLRQLLSCIL